MGHKCFVNLKKEDKDYKDELAKLFSMEDERYCILIKWDDFVKKQEKYVNAAFD